ncbi:NADPH-dependent assimilatory sulfite reductase flavoprotein subunit [Pantoea sp. Nvir]|uniref:NADPH-dependent assimilatory sulfite reductase flavoprotein subunit n=1 Tax=Pantoea sp. Nvir TaxID=2576760 RepID=UPI00135908A2|nr:NADPH-dependent assimilatory sulfite reductase flavoprotein subunit [Pantoea sp. Nvir]MXP66735.1 NADPH-dependent assimilatory sulfite reductase flavoprotein subunit [Pantoea sp. Nvir]CAJ0990985.1 Sulfite reductase [NADPH] flavoprotein alpha-component [Pantoea sp. Nvir]
MTTQEHLGSLLPLNPEQIERLQAATAGFTPVQLLWLSGYFWGMVNHQMPSIFSVSAPASSEIPVIKLISASQTGNARRVAEQLRDDLQAAQLNVTLFNAGDYKFKQIGQEKWLIVVISTHGEGEPPEEAMALHKFLMSKKAPKLDGAAFAVLGLGDISYDFFSKAGKDFDNRLAELGAERLLERVDADVDFSAVAASWRRALVKVLKKRVLSESPLQPSVPVVGSINVNKVHDSYTKESPLIASFAVNQKITGRHSDKDIRHIEIDLGDSPLLYYPGDALGVWYENDTALVMELLSLLWLQGNEPVQINNKMIPLTEALQKHFELTINTAQIVEQYATLSRNKILLALVEEGKDKLQHYAQHFPIVDMVHNAPTKLNAKQLTTLLRPLTPRLYSISSSQAENKTEVHITVSAVRFNINGKARAGGASSYLADRLEEDSKIRIFIQHNDNFRLPDNPDAPVIMIGSGTGIAPFRAFMQQRDNDGANGKNWLFFGNPHFTEDFLYQVEWQQYVKNGLLTNIDLAWSRDQEKKIYVQDKIQAKGAEVWSWIVEEGAYLYVCGNANRMAKDVENALLDIVVKHGVMDRETAEEFLSELRIKRRYQRDVY